jgi:hypothetical protein
LTCPSIAAYLNSPTRLEIEQLSSFFANLANPRFVPIRCADFPSILGMLLSPDANVKLGSFGSASSFQHNANAAAYGHRTLLMCDVRISSLGSHEIQ